MMLNFRNKLNHYLLLILYCLFSTIYTYPEGFVTGTPVKVSDGYVPIEFFDIGDWVVSYDFNRRKCVEARVIDISRRKVKRYVRIKLGDEYIKVAYDHKFYLPLERRWVKANHLRKGQILLSSSRTDVAIEEVKIINRSVYVYKLSVAKHHNFFVSHYGVLAHNAIAIGFIWFFGEQLRVIWPVLWRSLLTGLVAKIGESLFNNTKREYISPIPLQQGDIVPVRSNPLQSILLNDEFGENRRRKEISVNQIKQLIDKGKAPKSIKRIDQGGSPESPKDHIHFEGREALYRDGTWRHGSKILSNAEKSFLREIGFSLPNM